MQIKNIIITHLTPLSSIKATNPLYFEDELKAELKRLHLAQEIQLLPADDPMMITADDWNFDAFGQRMYFVKIV